MKSLHACLARLAALAAVVALGACSTPPQNADKVAAARPANCPIGSHICRHDGAAGPTDSVSAETLRNQGMTTMGGMEPGQMMHRGGGS